MCRIFLFQVLVDDLEGYYKSQFLVYSDHCSVCTKWEQLCHCIIKSRKYLEWFIVEVETSEYEIDKKIQVGL